MPDEIITHAEMARMVETLTKHLEFAKAATEDGWNARTERIRAFNMQAALKAMENITYELGVLTDALYAAAKEDAKKEKAKSS